MTRIPPTATSAVPIRNGSSTSTPAVRCAQIAAIRVGVAIGSNRPMARVPVRSRNGREAPGSGPSSFRRSAPTSAAGVLPWRSPKKRWPFQFVPAIALAIWDGSQKSRPALSANGRGEVPRWNTTATPRLSLCRASWLSRQSKASVRAVTSPNESIDRRGRDAVGASSVPVTLCSKRPDG